MQVSNNCVYVTDGMRRKCDGGGRRTTYALVVWSLYYVRVVCVRVACVHCIGSA